MNSQTSIYNGFKRLLPFQAKRWAQQWAAELFNLPVPRFGIPVSLARALPRNGNIVLIDVGASQGAFTLSLDRYCGVRKALLIEPQPRRVDEMKTKLAGKPFTIACAAAASDERLLEMEVLNWDYASSLLRARRDLPAHSASLDLGVREKIQVETSTLDAMCERYGFDGPIDLLKIDVQGAESMVISGSAKVLRRTGLIWMELLLQPLYEGAVTIEGMIGLCGRHGFVLRNLEPCFCSSNGELLAVDGLFAPEIAPITHPLSAR